MYILQLLVSLVPKSVFLKPGFHVSPDAQNFLRFTKSPHSHSGHGRRRSSPPPGLAPPVVSPLVRLFGFLVGAICPWSRWSSVGSCPRRAGCSDWGSSSSQSPTSGAQPERSRHARPQLGPSFAPVRAAADSTTHRSDWQPRSRRGRQQL